MTALNLARNTNTDNMGKLFVMLFADSEPFAETGAKPCTRTRSSTLNKIFYNLTIFWRRDNFVARPLHHCFLQI
jgi:hypothetical protein